MKSIGLDRRLASLATGSPEGAEVRVSRTLGRNSAWMIQSRFDFTRTVQLLEDSIKEAGNHVFAVIDQAAAAESVGMKLRPTTLIIFGNPKGGTPLMDAFPRVALELPLKLLVWDENGTVNVAYTPMTEAVARYGVGGMEARIAAMDAAVAALVKTIAQ